MNPKVVVAIVGAGGFIGRSLARHFAEHVSARTVLFGRSAGEVSGQHVASFPVSPADLEGVDVVIHLAGIAHQSATELDYQHVNVDLALSIAAQSLEAGVKRFIFISSIQVHGRWNAAPISPHASFQPTTPYARSKAEAERRLNQLVDESDMELLIIRPPLVYGVDAKANFAALMVAAKWGLPLPLGASTAERSMVSIDNLVHSIHHLTMSNGRFRAGSILLPADDRDLTVREVYSVLCRSVGRTAPLLNVPLWILKPSLDVLGKGNVFDSLCMPAVIDRVHWRALNWSPRQTVEDGLRMATMHPPLA